MIIVCFVFIYRAVYIKLIDFLQTNKSFLLKIEYHAFPLLLPVQHTASVNSWETEGCPSFRTLNARGP